jgi:hypothetical protein
MEPMTRRLPTLDQVRTRLQRALTVPSAGPAEPSSSRRRSGASGPRSARPPVRGRRRLGLGPTTRSVRVRGHRRSRCGHGTRTSPRARPRPDQVRTAMCTPSSPEGDRRLAVVRVTAPVMLSFPQQLRSCPFSAGSCAPRAFPQAPPAEARHTWQSFDLPRAAPLL